MNTEYLLEKTESQVALFREKQIDIPEDAIEAAKHMVIDKDHVDDEVRNQGALYQAIGALVVEAKKNRDRLKNELKQVEATSFLQLRDAYPDGRSKGGKTKDEIEAMVQLSPSVLEAQNNFLEADYLWERTKIVQEAVLQKGQMLKAMSAEYNFAIQMKQGI